MKNTTDKMVMKITINDIVKNGIWLTFPVLLFSLSLMNRLPAAFMPALFNKGIPDVLLYGENIGRILIFGIPAFFSIGISTKTQKRGLAVYLAGVALYYLSYLAQIIIPDSAWSTSMAGFVATAYTNLFWLIGLGLLGEKFYFPERLRYRPVYYFAAAFIFLIFHIAHTVMVYQRTF
ncbi:MAG: hypothetical protein MUO42_04985 [Anaerolineaceae bacterium]|nr:hypothetical protein [Anaerolineaceae bacterium]